MIRLAHVISTPSGFGGAERVLVAIANGAEERGWAQLVLNPMARSHREELALRLEAIPHEARPYSSRSDLPGTWLWLRRRLREFRPDLVFAVLAHAAVLTALSPRPAAAPRVLSHQHGMHFVAQGRRARALIDRWAGSRFDRVVACSDAVARFLVEDYRYRPETVVSIRNGWNGEPERPDHGTRPTIVCTARLREQKGHADLLRAFARVVEQEPACRLVLLGDGPLRERLEGEARALGIRDGVEFQGTAPDVWPWLARADVFALASHYEPLGIAVLEAMAAGLPVVATAVDGIPELIDDGVTGELVPPGNDAALAAALVGLLRDPQRRKAMGEAAKRRAEDERMERMVERYLDLFERAVADGSPRRGKG